MLSKWILKAIVQKTISFLPAGHRINYFFQKHITKGVQLNDAYLFDRLEHAQNHWLLFQKFGKRYLPERTLEIGTGWYPVVPITLFLAGVKEIYSVDIQMLTNKKHLRTTIQRLLQAIDEGRYPEELPIAPDRLLKLKEIFADVEHKSLAILLKDLHIQYLIRDARRLDFPDNHIDLVHSNNTFEHIYPDILEGILKEFWRINKGVMSHFIDMSDHFAHFDLSISVYNFLQFSEKQWRWIDNSIQPQNRWRFDDYLNLYKKLGIQVAQETHRPGQPEVLHSQKLAAPFHQKPIEVNAITHMHLVSVKEGRQASILG